MVLCLIPIYNDNSFHYFENVRKTKSEGKSSIFTSSTTKLPLLSLSSLKQKVLYLTGQGTEAFL